MVIFGTVLLGWGTGGWDFRKKKNKPWTAWELWGPDAFLNTCPSYNFSLSLDFFFLYHVRNAHFVSLRFYRAYYAVSGQLGKLDFPSSQSSLHTCSNTYLSWPSLPQPLTPNTPSHCLSISCIACLKTLPPFSSSERCFDSKLEVFKYEFAKVIRNKWRFPAVTCNVSRSGLAALTGQLANML